MCVLSPTYSLPPSSWEFFKYPPIAKNKMKKAWFELFSYAVLVASAVYNLIVWITPTQTGIQLDAYTVVILLCTLVIWKPFYKGLQEL